MFCGAWVGPLYKSYGPGNVSLAKCNVCGQVADPYVEQDWVMQALDLALLKGPLLRHMLCNDSFGAFRTVRAGSFFLLIETFVRVHRRSLLENVGAAQVAEVIWWSVVLRLLLTVAVTYALFCITNHSTKYGAGVLAALLVGSIVPLCLDALSLVWDYQQLWLAAFLLQLLLVASRASALNAVLRESDPFFCVGVAAVVTAF